MQSGFSEQMISKEFQACTRHLRKGIIVQPSVTSVFRWQVTLMPRKGFFQDRILTCLLLFDNFPASVPKVVFQSETFHPMIDPYTNQFDCSKAFSEWNVSIRVYTLINYVFDSFVDVTVPENHSVPNQEAAKLLRQGGDAFRRKALKLLHEPLDPTEKNELNVPRHWSAQKERISNILIVNSRK